MRKLTAIQLTVLAAYWVAAVQAWFNLPDRIPTHFSLSGVPDAWSRTTIWSWFGPPLIATLVTALLHFISAWSVRHPEHFNLPDKQKFLALSPEERAPILNTLRGMLEGLALLITLIFASVSRQMYELAHGAAQASGYSRAVLLGGVLLALLSGPWLLVRIMVQMQKATSNTKGIGTAR